MAVNRGGADDLSPRQREVLDMMVAFQEQHGVCPSYREIGASLGINSTNGVSDHVRALERKGYLERIGGRGAARAMRITSRARGTLDEGDTLGVPVLGRIAAGLPIAAQEDEEAVLRIDRGMLPGGAPVFGLRVRGDSMIGDGIHDGDIVFVRSKETCRDGEIAAVLVDGEATIKRVFREKGVLRLVPSNPDMEDILVTPDVGEVSIMGVVVAIWRQYF